MSSRRLARGPFVVLVLLVLGLVAACSSDGDAVREGGGSGRRERSAPPTTMPFAERLSAARATLDAADSANVCSLADAFAGGSAAAPGNAEEVREAVEYFSELFDAVVASAPASLQTPAQTLAAAADRFAADAAAAAYAPSIVPPDRPPAAFTTDEATAAMDAVATYLTDECGPAPA